MNTQSVCFQNDQPRTFNGTLCRIAFPRANQREITIATELSMVTAVSKWPLIDSTSSD